MHPAARRASDKPERTAGDAQRQASPALDRRGSSIRVQAIVGQVFTNFLEEN